MTNLATSFLTNEQIDDINMLEELCSANDAFNYSVYREAGEHDNNCFFLLYNGRNLIAYAGCFTADYMELSVLFHPDYRNGTIYDSFMDFILDDLWDQNLTEIYISGHKNQEWFNKFIRNCDAAYTFSEYLMSISRLINIPVVKNVDYKIVIKEQDCNTVYTLFVDKKEVGHCNVAVSGHLVNVWGVIINPIYRNKGFGKLLIKNVITSLLSGPKNDINIILQVSSNNIPACNVYKACGFEIKDSLDYYKLTL